MKKNKNQKLLIIMVCMYLTSSEANAFVSPDEFQHGINLEGWMESSTPSHSVLDEKTIAKLKMDGFDHFRLPVDPGVSIKRKEILEKLDIVVHIIESVGLPIIIDFHPGHNLSDEIDKDPLLEEEALNDLCDHVARYDDKKIIFELRNEPKESVSVWQKKSEKLFIEARNKLPNTTIIIGSANMNDIYSLTKYKPIEDKNVVYNFHYYTPLIFTHQGAFWDGNRVIAEASDVPFPMKHTEKMDEYVDKLEKSGNIKDAEKIRKYLDIEFSRKEIEKEFEIVSDWARKNSVRVVMTEFGAMKKTIPEDMRNAWLEAVRVSAENNHIGWTVWDRGSAFGIYGKDGRGEWVSKESTLQSLGLGRKKE